MLKATLDIWLLEKGFFLNRYICLKHIEVRNGLFNCSRCGSVPN